MTIGLWLDVVEDAGIADRARPWRGALPNGPARSTIKRVRWEQALPEFLQFILGGTFWERAAVPSGIHGKARSGSQAAIKHSGMEMISIRPPTSGSCEQGNACMVYVQGRAEVVVRDGP